MRQNAKSASDVVAVSAVRKAARRASVLATMLVLSCTTGPSRRPWADATSWTESSRLLATLPKDNLKSEHRAQWRRILAWPDDCEHAFTSTSASQVGLTFHTLMHGVTLVEVLCSAGAYQPLFRCYLIDESVSPAAIARVAFPTYEYPDGEQGEWKTQFELWGEPTFLDGRNVLTVLRFGRQTRDCGTWARYGFEGGKARILGVWSRMPCPEPTERPVDPDRGKPPVGWERIERDRR